MGLYNLQTGRTPHWMIFKALASIICSVVDLILLITYFDRNNAEDALQKLNGTVIGKQTVRLSWGRNPANKQANSLFLC